MFVGPGSSSIGSPSIDLTPAITGRHQSGLSRFRQLVIDVVQEGPDFCLSKVRWYCDFPHLDSLAQFETVNDPLIPSRTTSSLKRPYTLNLTAEST